MQDTVTGKQCACGPGRTPLTQIFCDLRLNHRRNPCTVGYASLIPLSNRGFRRCASMRIIYFHHQQNVYHGIFLYHEQIRLHTHDKLRSRAHALILPMLTSKAQDPLLLIPRTLKSALKSFAATNDGRLLLYIDHTFGIYIL